MDRIATLENENLNLKHEKAALENELCQLTTELQNLKISQTSPDEPGKTDQPEMEVSEEAARKRLERACKRNSQGTLGLMHFLVGSNSKFYCFNLLTISGVYGVDTFVIGKMVVPLRWYPSCLTTQGAL